MCLNLLKDMKTKADLLSPFTTSTFLVRAKKQQVGDQVMIMTAGQCTAGLWLASSWLLTRLKKKKKHRKKNKHKKYPQHRPARDTGIGTRLSQDVPGSLSLSRKSATTVTWNEVKKDIAHQAMSCSHDPLCQKFLSQKNHTQQALGNIHLWRPGGAEVLTSHTNCPILNRQELWIYEQIGKTLRKTFETHCPFQHFCLINSPSVPKSSMEKMKTPSHCYCSSSWHCAAPFKLLIV